MSHAKSFRRLAQLFNLTEHAAPLSQPETFSDLYQETHLLVFRYLYGLCSGALVEAEDLTAETFARAWKARHRFAGSSEAAIGWLLRIARSLAIDSYRREQVRLGSDDSNLEELPSPQALLEDQVAADEQRQILWRLMRELPSETRDMLVLRYMLGWPVKEIGQHLSIPENTVSAAIHRALQRLQREWPQEEE